MDSFGMYVGCQISISDSAIFNTWSRIVLTKRLPHLSGRKQWIYTCKTAHYSWQTVVVANSIKEARRMGYRDALAVMGRCAVIRSDEVRPL